MLDGGGGIVGEAEIALGLAEPDHLLGQGLAALAALGPYLAEGHIDAQLPALGLYEVQLGLSIGGGRR